MGKDAELIDRLKKNDEKAFEELFRCYFISLHCYAKFYTRDSQLAEDLVHDVFFKIWETRGKINVHTSIKAYLYRSVHNNCIQYLRHLKVVQEHNKAQENRLEEAMIINRLFFETGLTKLFEKEITELLEEAIAKMPEKTREIYVMSRKDHETNNSIAQKVNLTEKAVEYHISKALNFLRLELKDYLVFFLLFPGLFFL